MPQQVLELAGPERRVDGHEDGADLRQRELQHDPLGHVHRPQRDPLARPDAGRHQALGDYPRVAFQFGEPEASAGIDERVTVWQHLGEVRQERADGQIAHGAKRGGLRHDCYGLS